MSDDVIKMLTEEEVYPLDEVTFLLDAFVRSTANIVKKLREAGNSDYDIFNQIADLNRSFISPNKASAFLALALIRLAELNGN